MVNVPTQEDFALVALKVSELDARTAKIEALIEKLKVLIAQLGDI